MDSEFTLEPGERLVLRLRLDAAHDNIRWLDWDERPAGAARVLLRLPCGGELFTRAYRKTGTCMELDKAVFHEVDQLRGFFFCPLHCDNALDCPRFKDHIEALEKAESPVLAALWRKVPEAGHADGDESDVADFYDDIPDGPAAGHFARASHPAAYKRPRSLVAKVLEKIHYSERKAAKRCARKHEVDGGLRFHAPSVAPAPERRKDGGEHAAARDNERGAAPNPGEGKETGRA